MADEREAGGACGPRAVLKRCLSERHVQLWNCHLSLCKWFHNNIIIMVLISLGNYLYILHKDRSAKALCLFILGLMAVCMSSHSAEPSQATCCRRHRYQISKKRLDEHGLGTQL